MEPFAQDDIEAMRDALGVHMCIIETGTSHLTWNDIRGMPEEARKNFTYREPTSEQIIEADKLRKLRDRLTQILLNDDELKVNPTRGRLLQ